MSLQLGNNRLSLLFSGLLVASEANQNVAGFSLLRCGELLRVLFVIGLDVFFSRLRIHELIRREHHVLHLLVLRVHEISLVAVIVSLGLRIRHLHRLHKAGCRNREQTHFVALTEQLIHRRLGDDRRARDVIHEHFAGEALLKLLHEAFVSLTLAREEALIELGIKLAVHLETRGRFDHVDSLLAGDENTFFRDFNSESAFGKQPVKQRGAGLLIIENTGLEIASHLLLELLQLLALRLIELFRSDLGAADFGERLVPFVRAGIAIDACRHEGDRNRADDQRHHPALMFAETLKHGSLIPQRWKAGEA